MKPEIITAVGVFVLALAVQTYLTYATWQFIATEEKMERKCDQKNSYDWILEWYNWGNITSLVCLVLISLSAFSLLLKHHK